MYHTGKENASAFVKVRKGLPRERGKTFERTVAKVLSKGLEAKFERALGASRDGGSDVVLRPGQASDIYRWHGHWVIECKRTSRRELGTWWKQAAAQANPERQTPVLVYQVGVRTPRYWVFDESHLPVHLSSRAVEFYLAPNGDSLAILVEHDAIAFMRGDPAP